MEKLKKLFSQWGKEVNGKFVPDGIINLKKWEKANKKILVILKETNDFDNYGLNDLIDKNINNSKSGIWKGLTWHNIGRISYKLLNSNASFEEAHKKRKEILRYISVMNIKKTPGKNKSNYKVIQYNANKYGNYIKEEIEIINPDIVILGGTYKFLKNILNLERITENLYKEKGNDKRIYIKCYHPAYFGVKIKEYYKNCGKAYLKFIE